jgi:hypothetical protein
MNSQSNQRARAAFLVVASAIGVWITWDALSFRLVTYSLWADYWEHSATLTEWMRNLADPGNPHLAGGDPSSRYIPTFLAFAALGKLFGWSAIELMSISSIINYLVIATGIYLFSKAYFRNAWAPLITFVVLFTAWGVPWIWSNLYHLRSFFLVSAYPSSFVFGLSLIAFWYSLRFLRCQTGILSGVVVLLLLSALMFVSHALTGVFGIVGCCLLACTERGVSLGMRALVVIFLLGGALLADFWPYFSVWDVVLNKSDVVDDHTWQSFQGLSGMLARAQSGEWWHKLYDPRQLAAGLGLALFGLPICMWLLVKKKQPFILLGAAMMAVPYLGNIFYQVALGHRFLFYVVFFLHLAIVWAVLQLKDSWLRSRSTGNVTIVTSTGWFTTVAVLVFSFIANVFLLLSDYREEPLHQKIRWIDKQQYLPYSHEEILWFYQEYYLGIEADNTVVDVYTELTASLPESAIVIGEARLTWPLPTFRGKAVSIPEDRAGLLVPDEADRIEAERLFLDGATSDAIRNRIIQQYDVSHALISNTNSAPGLLRWLNSNAEQVAVVGRYEMYALNRMPR